MEWFFFFSLIDFYRIKNVLVSILILCKSSIRLWFPCKHNTIGNIDCITKALSRVSYLRMTCMESDIIRHLKGTKVYFNKTMVKPPLEKNDLYLFYGFLT